MEILPVAVMGLLFSFSSLFLFQSFNYMDAGIASTILFMYPVLVAVIMAVFFKERLSVVKIASIATAFVGISMLYKGEGGATLSMTGVCLVLMSSLTYALYIVGVNRSSLKEMPGLKLTFYAILFGSLVYIVRLRGGMDLQWLTEGTQWMNALGLAFVPVPDIHGDHCESHPEHRCHAGCHSRGVGAAYGIVRRCHGIPREAYGR